MERGVIDSYYLKGGVAMELRFARAARTTKDFDLGLEGNRTERIRGLGDVLQLAFGEFTFRLKPEIHEMELADTVRVEVAVQYKTRAWQTADIDLGPGEAREVDFVEPAITGLAKMGMPMAPHVRCLLVPGRSERSARGTFWIFCWSTCWASSIMRGRASRRSGFSPSGVLMLFLPVPHSRWRGDESWRTWPRSWDTLLRMRKKLKRGSRSVVQAIATASYG